MENKYFIYCRKSSEQEDRQVLSLDSQEKVLVELAKSENLNVVDILRESGSAHSMGRKIFAEVSLRLLKGEANGLIVWDESRIARNAGDGGMVINMFDIGKLVEIRKPGKTYRNTPDDKFFLTLLFGMSKKESDDKGVNVKRGLNTKAEKGWLPSGAKPGYANDKYAEKGNKTIKVDPERFPLIRKSWDLLLTGAYSTPKILKILNHDLGYRTPIRKTLGGKPMARSQLYRIFQDPFYYGYFEYPLGSGKWRQGSHEPMITKEEFDKVQIITGNKTSPRPKVHDFAYTGLIECGECGARITAEEKWITICTNCKKKFSSTHINICPGCETLIENMAKPALRHYIYYHCTKRKNPNCVQRSIRVSKLEDQFYKYLGEVNISERFKKWALKYLNELNESEVEDRNVTLNSLQNAYKLCVTRLDNLVKLKISPQNTDNSLLSDEEFKKQKEDIVQEKAQLETKLKETGVRVDSWLKQVEDDFEFAVQARRKFKTATLEEKREMMFYIGSKLLLKGGILDIFLRKPLQHAKTIVEVEPTVKDMFETTKVVERCGTLESYWAQNPLVLPRVDSDHEPSAYK